MLSTRCLNLFRSSSNLFNVTPRFRSRTILACLQENPVLVSANKDVFTNLALEHWLYNNLRFSSKGENRIDISSEKFSTPVVLIWTDEPCIVIGRHQNPWIETNLGTIYKNGFKLARRHSGGGCVFHDENNINISIIGNRDIFEKRQDNLKFIAHVLGDKYGINCEPTKRHDLVQAETNLKISGSAAKLGKYNCYHHFTVLVNSDKDALYSSIRQKPQEFISSNSTQSQRSRVINLCEIKPLLEVNQVITDLSNAYSKHLGVSPKIRDEPLDDPKDETREQYESLQEIRNELESWGWIYGMTPKFTLNRQFAVILGGKERIIYLTIQINKGLIESINLDGDIAPDLKTKVADYLSCLNGIKFTYTDTVVKISKLLQLDKVSDDNLMSNVTSNFGVEQVFATFLLQIVHDAHH